jgi:hypothetical protein
MRIVWPILGLLGSLGACTDARWARNTAAPQATLVVPPWTVVNIPVTLDATGSVAFDGQLLSYRFAVGDGSPPTRTGSAVTRHVFRETGTFQVCVQVVDSRGVSVQACASTRVTAKPEVAGDAAAERFPDGSGDAGDGGWDSAADAARDGRADARPPDQPFPDQKIPEQTILDQRPPDTGVVDGTSCFAPEATGGTGATGYTLKLVSGCAFSVGSTGSKLGVTTDESGVIKSLPFAFTFWGKSYGFAGVCSNGYLQFVGSGVPTLLVPTPAPIPSSPGPNNLVAAFWDNLAPLAPGVTDVRVATVGQAPKRVHIVEWESWTFSGSTGPAELVFSVFLYETTNVIELQYLKLSGGSRATGSQAAVGVENETGTQGVQYLFHQAGGLSTAVGIRFIPK